MKAIGSLKYMDWLSISIGCLGFIFVVFPKLTSIAIIALLGVIIVGYVKRELKFEWTKVSTILVLFYIIYLISAFWTTDARLAGSYLEYKLSLIIFPVLFSFKSKNKWIISPIIWGWFIGVTIVSLIGLYDGWLLYNETGNTHSFMSTSISRIHHPTYFSAFSTILLGLLWWANSKKIQGFNRWWLIPYTFFSIIHHFLLMSLAGTAFMCLLIAVFILVGTYRLWGKYALIFAIILMPLVSGYLANNVNIIQNQIYGVSYYMKDYVKDPSKFILSRNQVMSGNEIRLCLWTVACQEFCENPMGVGIGSMEARMDKRLRSYGQNVLADLGMNPHNQYLQIGVEIGIIGLLVFLCLLGYLVIKAIRTKNYLLMLLISNLAFNCLFESMLQRQSGIVFYTFWIFLLIHWMTDNSKKTIVDV
ncbi:MAG: O-antigen ligase family protein [Crocinitomicaceae bacterium]|nr:O-antigen ligase family protein [Crocinitomicaceae bacterium]